MTNELIRRLTPRADSAKCQGMNCKTQNNCLRFLRPVATYRQAWRESWREKTPCPDYQPAVLHPTTTTQETTA